MSSLFIESGRSGLTISSGVSAYVRLNGSVTNCKVTSGGRLYIESTGAASGTTVSKGGLLCFSSGCRAGTVNTISSGGIVRIESGALVNSVTALNGAVVSMYATAKTTYEPATSFTVTSNGVTLKCNGSSFGDWDMKTSGSYLCLGGLSANSIKVSNGCTLAIGGGSRYNSASVNTVNVYSGGSVGFARVGTVGQATVHAGGILFVGDGATTSATIVENGGYVMFYDGDLMLTDPGYNLKIKPNTFYNVVAGGAVTDYVYVTAHSGTTAVNTTLNDSASLLVYRGGKAVNTFISKGHLTVSSGGVAQNVFITSGGGITVVSGGKITGIISMDGGNLIVSSGGVIDFDISGITGGATTRFINFYNIPSNVGYLTNTITVSASQEDGIYSLATGAYQLGSSSSYRSAAEKTLTIYNTSGKKLGTIAAGQTVTAGSAKYTLTLTNGNLNLAVSGSKPATFLPGCFAGGVRSKIAKQSGNKVNIFDQGGIWGNGVTMEDGWKAVAVGDFNKDGRDDILRVSTDGYVVGEMSNGNGTFSATVLNKKNAGWNILGAGDFNGDRKDDVLVANPTGASSAVGLIGYWDGGTTWQLIDGYSAEWEMLATGDFDKDGRTDMLWRNSFNSGGQNYNAYCTWLMNGSKDWRMVSVANTAEWDFLGAGDFNGDGFTDIAMINNGGTVGIWGVVNGLLTTWDVVSAVDRASWAFAGVGDYNGDGTDDIAWQNRTNGLTGYWVIASNHLSSWQNFATIA